MIKILSFSGEPEAQQVLDTMKKLGYEKLGSGFDKVVWTKDKGSVVLTLMPESHSQGIKVFKKWYEYVERHKDNPHLPRFVKFRDENGNLSDFSNFHIGRTAFLQVGMERLKELGFKNSTGISQLLGEARAIAEGDENMIDDVPPSARLFVRTCVDLWHLSKKYNFEYDLHRNNVMRRGSTFVITDPWAGYTR